LGTRMLSDVNSKREALGGGGKVGALEAGASRGSHQKNPKGETDEKGEIGANGPKKPLRSKIVGLAFQKDHGGAHTRKKVLHEGSKTQKSWVGNKKQNQTAKEGRESFVPEKFPCV